MLIHKIIPLFIFWFGSMLVSSCAFSQTLTQGVPETGTQKEISLEDLLGEAAENNPEIRASAHTAAASKAMIPAAGALPDPTVTFESMGRLAPPTLMKGDPSSARTYGVEQEFPFPGKRGLKESIALVSRRILSEVKQAYFDLFLITRSIDTLTKTRELLQNLTRVAEARYQVGQTTQQDVLKAQVEQSKILDRLLALGQKKRITEAKINNLLHRPSETPAGRPADFRKAELAYSLEELSQLALSAAPELKAKESEISRRQYGVDLAKKEYYPDFAVGFTYYERDQNPEMYGLKLSAKLPLYFWQKQKPELNAAKLNLSSARSMRDSTASTVQYQVREIYTTAITLEKLANLYSSAVIPQSNLALNSAIANYQVGKIDFLQLIDASMSLLEYELKYYESMSEFHKALAQLEPLIGVGLLNG